MLPYARELGNPPSGDAAVDVLRWFDYVVAVERDGRAGALADAKLLLDMQSMVVVATTT